MKSWTILEILNWTKEFFREKQIENPRLNAEILVSHVLDLKRLDLYLKFDQIVTPEEREMIKQMIIRRSKNEPLQYILGETEFYDCRIKVNKSVLIPRPETELLVEKVIEHSSGVTNILDIGTGSGCIAIALAKELDNVQIDAVDISSEALQTARENAELNGAEVKFFQSDVFSRITKKI